MRYVAIFILILLLGAPVYAEEKPLLATDKDRVNYSIGVYLANTLRSQGIEFNPTLVMQGFSDSTSEKALLLNDDEINRSIMQYQRAVRQNRTGKSKHNPAADNLKVGEKFLAENRDKTGVVQTTSGLQYRVLKQGSGRIPAATDTVEYNFRELLLNRKEVASSDKNGKPEVVKISNELLPALREALLMMKTGSKWELYIPAHLAYGEAGKGHEVPPNSALIYEVELLAIK